MIQTREMTHKQVQDTDYSDYTDDTDGRGKTDKPVGEEKTPSQRHNHRAEKERKERSRICLVRTKGHSSTRQRGQGNKRRRHQK